MEMTLVAMCGIKDPIKDNVHELIDRLN
jgi:P-type E1-E2 ATPase